MSLAHEDSQGGFLFQQYKDENIAWLQDAADDL